MATIIAGLAIVACGSSSSVQTPTAPSAPSTPTVTALTVSGTAPAVGASVAFSARATLSDGTTQDVTSQATWTTSNGAVATVSATGSVTGVAAGDADIKAAYQTVTGSMHVTIAAAACRYSLSTTTIRMAAGGGTATVDVSASAATCAWTASSDAGFASITAGGSGTGNGSVTIAVAANAGGGRNATVTIAGVAVAVAQDGVPVTPACTSTSVSSTNLNFGEAAFSSFLTVTAGNCSWTATSNAPFITITSGASGVGTGTVAYSFTANTTGARRSGTMTIGGNTVTISQDPCGYRLIPQAGSVLAASPYGETFEISVIAIDACTWTASTRETFAKIASGATGAGTGKVVVTFAPYPSGGWLVGEMTVANQPIYINQSSQACMTVYTGATAITVPAAGYDSGTIGLGDRVCSSSFQKDADWLHVTNYGFSLAVWSADRNTGPARTGHVTAQGAGSPGKVVITVTQEAGTP